MEYNHRKIEKKWQQHWLNNKTFKTKNNNKPKYYVLDMFPYPSASGLHVGHIEGYTATDIVARFKRMSGYDVLHPMGWDAFGLPAEQYALLTGNDPRDFTYKNIKNYKRQIIESGMSIDWDRELATADSQYYRWTQWIFKKLLLADLAELKDVEVNWCKELSTVLANDEIIIKDGQMVSERGEHLVVKKAMKQWVLKITKYADRLLSDLDLVDWPENLKEMQRNWIGKSSGLRLKFFVFDRNQEIEIYTTRLDTIYGVSYLALAPEHPLVEILTKEFYKKSVFDYLETTKSKNDLDRMTSKEKTGVFTGSYALNPIDNKKIPIWIADYVLPHYGTKAIMGVPAHDERDYDFAVKYHLEIIKVIAGDTKGVDLEDGIHINSPLINGLNIQESIDVLTKWAEDNKIGFKENNYRIRDWVFSRQRYWGEPFPVFYDENNHIYLTPDAELPLLLPQLKEIKPSGTGESPLANANEWLYLDINGKKGRRDTNTMPQLAGSAWYYIGYVLKHLDGIIPLDSQEAQKELKKWLPVDLYIGGTEHAVGHLLYARFWHKFLYDLGILETKEPFLKLVNQGMILGSDHSKMSKSRGNVVNPDEIINDYGADTLRLFEMFMGPLESEKPWTKDGVNGAKRFLDRIVRMFDFEIVDHEESLDALYNQTVKKVTLDFEKLSFNTAISQLMVFLNEVYKVKRISYSQAQGFLKMLNPICPHITEEINQVVLKSNQELSFAEFPKYNSDLLVQNIVEIVIQVNGKIRAKVSVEPSISDEKLKEMAFKENNVAKFLEGLTVQKVIIIPEKILNIVAS